MHYIQNQVQQESVRGQARLKKCTLKYALASVDPFDPLASGACNPAFTASLSHKITTQGGFGMTIGTQGVGWALLFMPATSQNILAFVTGATYTGTIASPCSANNTLNTGVSVIYPNLPYVQADVNQVGDQSNLQIIPVSAGFRARYTGTTLNEGGMYHCFADPDHVNVCGMDQSAIINRTESGIAGVSRDPCSVVLNCVDQNDAENPLNSQGLQNSYPFSYATGLPTTYQGGTSYTYQGNDGINCGNPTAIILVTGQPGNTFFVDYKIILNAHGPKASQFYTPHESDTQGAVQVMAAAQQVPAKRNERPKASSWSLMQEALTATQDGLKEFVVPASVHALASLLI